MKNIAQTILKYKWFSIVLVLLITVFLGFQLKNLEINADIISSLPDDDPDALLLKRIGENFGGNNMGVIILETDNIYQTQVIEHIRSISDSGALSSNSNPEYFCNTSQSPSAFNSSMML